jgi:hypothetical protein
MLDAILTAIPSRDFTLDQPDTAWRVLKRRWKDAEVYLIFNEQAIPATHTVTLTTPANRIEVWNPQTAAITPAPTLKSPTGPQLTIALQPYETRVLVVR